MMSLKQPEGLRPALLINESTGKERLSSPASRSRLEAGIRTVPEIPCLVINADGPDFTRGERNLVVSADLDDAAFTHNRLVETPTVFQFDGDNLISGTRLRSLPQIREALLWNGE